MSFPKQWNSARSACFTWTGDEETILQVNFVGPVAITFVNPADDPRKKP